MVYQVVDKLGQFLVHVFDFINIQGLGDAYMRATGTLIFETCSENAGNLSLQIDLNGHKLGRARPGVHHLGTG